MALVIALLDGRLVCLAWLVGTTAFHSVPRILFALDHASCACATTFSVGKVVRSANLENAQSGGNGLYTAAASTSLFGSATWCGSGCGTCFKLTSTGSAPSGQGTGGAAGSSITVMVTNLCPYNGNEKWCPQR